MKIIHDERSDGKSSGFNPKQKLILSIAGLATLISTGITLNNYLNNADSRLKNSMMKNYDSIELISKPDFNKNTTNNNNLDSTYSVISTSQNLDDFNPNPQDSTRIDTLKTYEISNFGRFYLGKSSSLNSQILIKDVDNDGREDFIRYDPYLDVLEIYKNKIVNKKN
jgi:hypothetical protein